MPVQRGLCGDLGPDGRATALDLSPDLPWSMGARLVPNYASSVGGTERRYLIDVAKGTSLAFGLCYDPSGTAFRLVRWQAPDQIVVASTPAASFAVGEGITVAAGWDPSTGEFFIGFAKDGQDFPEMTAAAGAYSFSLGRALADQIRVGASVSGRDGTAHSAQGTVSCAWVRQGAPATAVSAAFHARPDYFSEGRGPADRANGAWRALFLAPLVGTYSARVGPGEGYYEGKQWTPIPRDFVLRRGITPLPPTTAAFLKLEFSDLVARPYSVPRGCTMVHRDYPTWVHKWHDKRRPPPPKPRVRRGRPGRFITSTLLPSRREGIRGEGGLQAIRQRLESSGEELQIASPTSRARRDSDDADNRPRRIEVRRRFYRAGVHEYSEQKVRLTRQEAYFVGLRDVVAYRISYPT